MDSQNIYSHTRVAGFSEWAKNVSEYDQIETDSTHPDFKNRKFWDCNKIPYDTTIINEISKVLNADLKKFSLWRIDQFWGFKKMPSKPIWVPKTKLAESLENDPILSGSTGVFEQGGSPNDIYVLDYANESQGRASNLSKSKVNAKLLKNYNCKIEERANVLGGVSTVYICKYGNCGKEFTRSWSILDHVRMHEGIKPYVCKVCAKAYTQKGNMQKHMRKHGQQGPAERVRHVCEFCSASSLSRTL